MGKDSPKFGMGIRLEDVHRKNNDKNPGPGTYEQQSVLKSSPFFVMGPPPIVKEEENLNLNPDP